MGFIDSLRKTFLYTGESHSEEEIKENKQSKEEEKPRLDISNPIRRFKDIKEYAVNSVRNNSSISKATISDYTQSLIYESMHNVVEKELQKGKPFVEAKLLYKKFLEDQVTDEAMYSDADIEYIKALVRHIKELKSIKAPDNLSREEIADKIASHPYLLNIIEVLDIQHNYNAMNYFCDISHVICGYSYRGKESKLANLLSSKIPHFYMDINDSTFIMLNDIKSLISNESSTEDKKNYIIDKVSPLVTRYAAINDIPKDLLYYLLTMFNNLYTKPESENPYIRHDLDLVFVNPNESDITEQDIQAKMFNGIQNDINPITTLRTESVFSNVYSELADPRNPDVTLEELEEAINDISLLIDKGDFELSPSEFKVFSTIKSRYKMMKDGVV